MRFKQGVAVEGSHGKTTTTSMNSSVLASAGLDPTYVLGGRLMGAETGARLGKGEYLVVEADESDGSFLDLMPVLGVITNIDNDHLAFYDNNIEKLRSAFVSFVHKLPFYGTVFSSSGDETVRLLAPEFGRKTILVGEKEESDIQVINIESDVLKTKFSIISISKFVPIKQLNASCIEHTIGSPLTLKEVFTNTGHPVIL